MQVAIAESAKTMTNLKATSFGVGESMSVEELANFSTPSKFSHIGFGHVWGAVATQGKAGDCDRTNLAEVK
jgi:hypothetical protein